MISPNACEEKSVWIGLLSVSLEPQWQIWERFLAIKISVQEQRKALKEQLRMFTSRLRCCKSKGHRRCCVRCRQTTKHLILRNCCGETKTGETRSNYIPRREMSCVHMAVGLEQRIRRPSSFYTSFSTRLP